jgi:two-component system response regulator FixJ
MQADQIVHVIDDDEAMRHSLEFLLDCAGLKARTHASATQFLQVIATIERGCIVSDVRMPDMSGLELVSRLKDLGIDDPVIIITGHADVPLAIEAMKAGVVDFLEKPVGDQAMLKAVRAALDQRSSKDRRQSERSEIRARLASLSPREREVIDGLVAGHANKAIAYDLEISARTVEVYRANVMTKMHAGSLSELVRMVTIAELD